MLEAMNGPLFCRAVVYPLYAEIDGKMVQVGATTVFEDCGQKSCPTSGSFRPSPGGISTPSQN